MKISFNIDLVEVKSRIVLKINSFENIFWLLYYVFTLVTMTHLWVTKVL
jgi:hypothetical protein